MIHSCQYCDPAKVIPITHTDDFCKKGYRTNISKCLKGTINCPDYKPPTQTEELRENLAQALYYDEMAHAEPLRPWESLQYKDKWISLANTALLTCKKSGLKFVKPAITSDPEVGNEIIKEIEA